MIYIKEVWLCSNFFFHYFHKNTRYINKCFHKKHEIIDVSEFNEKMHDLKTKLRVCI